MLQVIFLFVLLFSLLVAVVAVQNTTPVTLHVLVFEVPNVALSVLVLIALAVGAFLALLLGLGTWIGNVRAIRQRDQTIRRLEAELARVRAAHESATVATPALSPEHRGSPPEGGAEPAPSAGEPPPARTGRPFAAPARHDD